MSRVPIDASSEPEAWSTAAPPLPVQPLGYSEGDRSGAWGAVVTASAWAAIAMGVTQLITSVAQWWGPAVQMMWSSPGARNNFFTSGWQPFLVLQLACDVGAVALIVAGAAAFRRQPWVPTGMTVAAATVAVSAVGRSLMQTYQMFSNPAFTRSFTTGRSLFYVISTFSASAHGLILPALLVWVMTGPAVRQHFRGLLPG